MEFFETVETRRSCRQFSVVPVEPEKLAEILEAANQAPSAGNLQAYQIIVVKSPAVKARLEAASGNQRAVARAPIVLVFCAAPERSAACYGARGEQLFCVQDATIACAYAQLAATALGLASVWIGAVQEPEVAKEALRLKEDLWPIIFLPIGYAAETPPPRSRRALADLVWDLPPA